MKKPALVAAAAVGTVGLIAVIPIFALMGMMASSSDAACGTGQPAVDAPAMSGKPTGGRVRDAGGGVFVGGKWHYREDGGPKWTFEQIARKATEYGLPGKAMAQVAQGESSFHPYIVQHDPGDGNVGFGFFQFTPNAWGGPDGLYNQKLKQLGGQKGLEDIDKQFEMARFMYIATGHNLQSWHGTDFVTDWSEPRARPISSDLSSGPIVDAVVETCASADVTGGSLDGKATLKGPIGGGEWLAPVPGFEDAKCDKRILSDLVSILKKFKMKPGDCWACPTCGHASDGEHPLGLGVDLYPDEARGGTWADVDAAARWSEPSQDQPIKPFRWVGYNGDYNHGTGNHLHLSWAWVGDRGPPVDRVWTLAGGGA